MKPSRDTPSGRAYRDLQNLGRRQLRPTDELLALYALEGFLDRLSSFPGSADFALKGGVLLAAYNLRRPTRDIDLLAHGLRNEEGEVLEVAREIASTHRDDGLTYDVDGATAETIREGDDYSGVRILMMARLARARLPFNIDVNVGDPVWPAPLPVQVPRLLGGEISLRGYPLSMVLAEKLVTAVQRGAANTRWRDFADVYLLSGTHEVDGGELQESMRVVAVHREAQLVPLADALSGYAELAQTRWRAWISKQRLTERLPSSFTDVLNLVTSFADPPLQSLAFGTRWTPTSRRWLPAK